MIQKKKFPQIRKRFPCGCVKKFCKTLCKTNCLPTYDIMMARVELIALGRKTTHASLDALISTVILIIGSLELLGRQLIVSYQYIAAVLHTLDTEQCN